MVKISEKLLDPLDLNYAPNIVVQFLVIILVKTTNTTILLNAEKPITDTICWCLRLILTCLLVILLSGTLNNIEASFFFFYVLVIVSFIYVIF